MEYETIKIILQGVICITGISCLYILLKLINEVYKKKWINNIKNCNNVSNVSFNENYLRVLKDIEEIESKYLKNEMNFEEAVRTCINMADNFTRTYYSDWGDWDCNRFEEFLNTVEYVRKKLPILKKNLKRLETYCEIFPFLTYYCLYISSEVSSAIVIAEQILKLNAIIDLDYQLMSKLESSLSSSSL